MDCPAQNSITAHILDKQRAVIPLADIVPALQLERHVYFNHCCNGTIDHTENAEDHCFTEEVHIFFAQHSHVCTAWAEAARMVFALTASSAAAESVFSLLRSMFGESQEFA